ncbi:MAG: hypothetical protein GY847_29590 [Proteobacteria bacterium]|nr:hypothetical protein [Pseudomonadota bacterium]
MMIKLNYILAVLSVGFVIQVTSCSDNDDSSEDEAVSDTDSDTDSDQDITTDTDSNTDTDTDIDTDTTIDDGLFPNGQNCRRNEQCKSDYCDLWQGIPLDLDAECADGPPKGQLLLRGTAIDFLTRNPIPGAKVKFVSAIESAMMGCASKPIGETTTNELGRYELLLNKEVMTDPLGIIAHTEVEGYYFTGNGIASPTDGIYGPGAEGHDAVAITESLLNKISALLEDHPTAKYHVPLGEKGGVVGEIGTLSSGEGIEGAYLKSRKGDDSDTIILYPNEDFTALQDATSSTGIYVGLNPDIGEKFDAYDKNGVKLRFVIDGGTMGSTPCAIFYLCFWDNDVD